jgi:hypothetical protein
VAGKVVPPSRVSETLFQAPQTPTTLRSASEDDSFGSTSTGIEIGVISSLLLVAATLGVLWRRGRLSTI